MPVVAPVYANAEQMRHNIKQVNSRVTLKILFSFAGTISRELFVNFVSMILTSQSKFITK